MSRGATRQPRGQGARFVLVASRFNEPITRALVAGARQTLIRHGVAARAIRTVWVPGAFELPVAAACVAAAMRPQGIVALGCVLKGRTPQYAAIGHAVAQGLAQVSVHEKIPVALGVIVADSVAQARARAGLPAPRSAHPRKGARPAGGSMGNRGSEAAEAALAMVEILRSKIFHRVS